MKCKLNIDYVESDDDNDVYAIREDVDNSIARVRCGDFVISLTDKDVGDADVDVDVIAVFRNRWLASKFIEFAEDVCHRAEHLDDLLVRAAVQRPPEG